MTSEKKQGWEWWYTVIWGVFIIILPIVAFYQVDHLIRVWWFFIAGFILILLITGHGVTGSWKGALIDNRNVLSLSRFQMMAWTTLVLSAFTAAVFWNIFKANALNLGSTQSSLPGFPGELWLLMGISTASLVGSPLILSGKKKQHPDQNEVDKTFELLSEQGYDKSKLDNQGQLVVNKSPDQANWSDLFTGEETGNFAHLDVARLQMFFFTLVSLLTYGVAIGHSLGEAASATPEMISQGKAVIAKFPELSEGLLALIGISHTGYLAAKATANSQTGNEPPTESIPPSSSDHTGNDHPAVG